MKKEVISIVMAGILAVGACGCGKSDGKKKGTGKLPSATTSDEVDESRDEGTEGDPVDLSSGDKGTAGPTSSASDTSGRQREELDPNRLVFTYEHSNYAWGSQQSTILFFGDGRIYSFYNDMFALSFARADTTMNDDLRSRIDLLSRIEPLGTIDPQDIFDLYSFADQIDPNAKVEKEHVMYDYGQITLYYWTEEGTKLMCMSEGDFNYIIDDPNVSQIESLWDLILMKMQKGSDYENLSLYLSSDLPMTTLHCGYIELPQNSTGHYIFKNYDDFLAFAKKYGIELTGMELFEKEGNRERPVFVQFDIFNTMGYERAYDAVVIEDDTFYFLPSENCKDPGDGDAVGQALDGFITICTFGSGDKLPESGYKTQNGALWEVYDPAAS